MIAAFCLGVSLLGAVLCCSLGTARLFGWLLDYRAYRIDAAYRAARLVAVCQAELRRD